MPMEYQGQINGAADSEKCMMLAGSSAFAQDSMKKNAMTKDEMKK